jgi:type IV pilus assembly protein PilQ
MVNLPVTGVSEGPSAALALGYVADKVSLDLQLSALQESGAAKILSSPKVMVMEHQEALISTGTEILVPTTTTTAPGAPGTVATTTTTVTEKRATLSLRVSPRVVDEDLIALSISTSRDEFDFSKAVLGIPPKLTRTASTELLVRAGSTVVIGGIYARTESTAKREVPLLGKLPLLGWLFKRQQRSQDRVELLIFLTPQVVKP